MIRPLAALLYAASLAVAADKKDVVPDYVTPKEKILQQLPETTSVPGDVASIMGAAHAGGLYHFTNEPYLVEGCKDVLSLGMRGVKLWFTAVSVQYLFNSEWNLPKNPTLLEQAKHPYFEAAFAMPFDYFALEVQPVHGRKVTGYSMDPDSDFAADEQQVYELASYLLTKFKDRSVTFILQNWEGDWMLASGEMENWKKGVYPEAERRAQAMVRWINARQRAVEKARAEHPGTKCKVLHGVEVNQVLWTWKGVPTVTSSVLPHVKTDLISWSCYDGLQGWKRSADVTAVGLWQGIETLKHFGWHDGHQPPIYMGEIGLPENSNFTTEDIRKIWYGAFRTLFAQKTPYIIQWEIYNNELKDGSPPSQGKTSTDPEQQKGYWIRKPDGSLSPSGEYLVEVLKSAGKPLPKP